MKTKLTKNDSMSEVDMLDFEKKRPLLRKHLEFITDNLMELAKLTNANEEEKNDLLLSFEEWPERGCIVKRYENGYLFWINGDIVVLYCREQVKQIQLTLFAL